jgi:hypothetical protein
MLLEELDVSEFRVYAAAIDGPGGYAATAVRRALTILLVVLTLAACGGGGGGDGACTDIAQAAQGELTFSASTPQQTTEASLFVVGRAFVPRNSTCELVVNSANPSDPWSPPTSWQCECKTLAPVCVSWKNETSGESGTGRLASISGHVGSSVDSLYCTPDYANWDAGIPLVLGSNTLTVAMQDGRTRGSASVTVMRD